MEKNQKRFGNLINMKYMTVCLLFLLMYTRHMVHVSAYEMILDEGEKMERWSRDNKIYVYDNMKDIPADIDKEYSFVMTFSSYNYRQKFDHVSGMTLELMFPPLVYSLMEYKKNHSWTDDYTF